MLAAAARPLRTWTKAARAAKEALRITVLDTRKVRLHPLYDGRVKTTARLEAEQVRTLWRHMTMGPRHLGTCEAERGHIILGYRPTEADTLVTVNRYGTPREYKEFERKLGQNAPVLDLGPKPPVAYRVCLDKEVASALFG